MLTYQWTDLESEDPQYRLRMLKALGELAKGPNASEAWSIISYIAQHDSDEKVRFTALEMIFLSDEAPNHIIQPGKFAESGATRKLIAQIFSRHYEGEEGDDVLIAELDSLYWQERAVYGYALWHKYPEGLPKEVLKAVFTRFQCEYHLEVIKSLVACLSRSGDDASVRRILLDHLKKEPMSNLSNYRNDKIERKRIAIWQTLSESNRTESSCDLLHYLMTSVANHAANEKLQKQRSYLDSLTDTAYIVAHYLSLEQNRLLLNKLIEENHSSSFIYYCREAAYKQLKQEQAVFFLLDQLGVTFSGESEAESIRKESIQSLQPLMKHETYRQHLLNTVFKKEKPEAIIDTLTLIAPYKQECASVKACILSFINIEHHENVILKAIVLMQDEFEDEKIFALVKGIYNQASGRLKILTMPYIARFESTEEMFALCQEQLKSSDVELGLSCIRTLRYFDLPQASTLKDACRALFLRIMENETFSGWEFLNNIIQNSYLKKQLYIAAMPTVVKYFYSEQIAKNAFMKALMDPDKDRQSVALNAASELMDSEEVRKYVMSLLINKNSFQYKLAVEALQKGLGVSDELTRIFMEQYIAQDALCFTKSCLRPYLINALVPKQKELPFEWEPNSALVALFMTFDEIEQWNPEWEQTLFYSWHLKKTWYRAKMRKVFHHFMTISRPHVEEKALALLEPSRK